MSPRKKTFYASPKAIIGGSVDGITFEAFVASRLVPTLRPGAYVVMDNCAIHLGKRIEELITQVGAHLIYLPPYSPEFSPIETMWSKVKSILRSIGARTYPELAQAIEEAYSQISIEDIKG